MKPLKSLLVVLPVLVVLAACSSATDTTPTTATNTVTLNATTFEPATITIKVGESVTWKWATGTHNVQSGTSCAPDAKFSSGEPVAGGAFEQKFDTAGTFDYFCSVHCGTGMVGKVIVQ
jgi:plastocyanin